MILLLSTVAHAEPLWVEADQVDAVRATLDALWPDGPLEVLARPDELQGEGLLWVGGLLVWIHEGRAWTERAEDPATAVLLARSWSRTPPVDLVELPPAPIAPPPVIEEPDRAEPAWLASAGVQASDGLDGVRVGGARLAGQLEVGASLFVSTRAAANPSALEANLDDLQLITALEARDVVAVGASGVWHFVGRPTTSAPRVGPVVSLGLQVGEQVARDLSGDGITFDATSRIRAGVLAGLGADLWLAPRWSLMGSVVDRFDLDRSLEQRILMGLDLRVALP
ncbi:MAG: hypothetical protein KC621_09230 [Myxococcales bacterium]|nr:hypothetical protein [Myxococcales bacterium]